MSNKFDHRIQVVRLAQQIAQVMAASQVPRDEWNMVLQFVKVMTNKGSSSPEDLKAENLHTGKDEC